MQLPVCILMSGKHADFDVENSSAFTEAECVSIIPRRMHVGVEIGRGVERLA
jgi:hypothetical protein